MSDEIDQPEAVLAMFPPAHAPIEEAFLAWAEAKAREGRAMEAESDRRIALTEVRRIVAVSQSIVDRLQKVFRCPTCGQPSRMKAAKQKARTKKGETEDTGLYAFYHDNTSHGGSRGYPEVKLM